tara:strand:- start:110 stop:598 length:489 start_codon:yes stop_codon:yes gene_type:complete
MRAILLFSVCFVYFKASACSLAPMLNQFDIQPNEIAEQASKPSFTVSGIHRGTDDGNHGSCSDAGVITLKLQKAYPNQGYIFEIVDGEFEDLLFNNFPVTPSEFVEDKSIFSFIWFDGSSIEQEPFSIKVKIIAVSRTGNKSTPQYLTIAHAGVKKPWWRLW